MLTDIESYGGWNSALGELNGQAGILTPDTKGRIILYSDSPIGVGLPDHEALQFIDTEAVA